MRLLLLPFMAIFLLSVGGCVKKEAKVYRVGILSGLAGFAEIAEGFKSGMSELGYKEGKDIIYDIQVLDADSAAEQRVARKFVVEKVDLIFAFPTGAALAAKKASQGTNIPVVFAISATEGTGLIDKVHRPGGNITGVRFPGLESTVKRLEILHELVPQAKRIYLVYNGSYPSVPPALSELHSAASLMGITLVEDSFGSLGELKVILEKRSASGDIGVDAILVMPEMYSTSKAGFELIREFAAKHRLPIGGTLAFTVDLGALFSFFPDNVEMGKTASTIADKIFKGEPAGSVMVATPKTHLRLNHKAIQDFGLKASEGLLTMADEIIR